MQHKVRFLVKADSWETVKTLFREELGIIKDKRDESVTSIRDHFVVEVRLSSKELNDDFYQAVQRCDAFTITFDELSLKRGQDINEMIAPVELQLRELAIYAHDLAATYYNELKNVKSIEAKRLARSSQMLSGGVLDPLPSFLDFGELIAFLGKTGNEIDESNLADDTARLIETSADFDEFKKVFAQKFKKLTIWEMIAGVTIRSPYSWSELEADLNTLKDIRNAAAHFRIVKPKDVNAVQIICKKLEEKLQHKKKPTVQQIKSLDEMFESWNASIQTGALQTALERIANLNTSAMAQSMNKQLEAQYSISTALEKISQAQQRPPTSLQSVLSQLSGIKTATDNTENKSRRTDKSTDDTRSEKKK